MLENIFICWGFLVWCVVSFMLSLFLITVCSDEPNIDRKKLWFVIFILGPASWIGAIVALCGDWFYNNTSNIANIFRKKL